MKKVILSIATVFVFSFLSFSQDNKTTSHAVSINVENFALLDIEGPGGSTSISLKSTTPTEPGLGITFDENATDNSLWLNYSSIVAKGSTRKVTAKVDGTLPEGIDLMLKANSYGGNGKGKNGTLSNSSAQKLTSASETEVIKEIGSCYTGNGVSNGHNLEYAIRVTNNDEVNYEKIESGAFNINVVYTISD